MRALLLLALAGACLGHQHCQTPDRLRFHVLRPGLRDEPLVLAFPDRAVAMSRSLDVRDLWIADLALAAVSSVYTYGTAADPSAEGNFSRTVPRHLLADRCWFSGGGSTAAAREEEHGRLVVPASVDVYGIPDAPAGSGGPFPSTRVTVVNLRQLGERWALYSLGNDALRGRDVAVRVAFSRHDIVVGHGAARRILWGDRGLEKTLGGELMRRMGLAGAPLGPARVYLDGVDMGFHLAGTPPPPRRAAEVDRLLRLLGVSFLPATRRALAAAVEAAIDVAAALRALAAEAVLAGDAHYAHALVRGLRAPSGARGLLAAGIPRWHAFYASAVAQATAILASESFRHHRAYLRGLLGGAQRDERAWWRTAVDRLH
jgi:hypothetical protein